MTELTYTPRLEAKRIFETLCKLKDSLSLPADLDDLAQNVTFSSEKDEIYFPIPFKETETTAALKGLEAVVAAALANLKYGEKQRKINICLEQATCFLFQTYLSSLDGMGKYDQGIKARLKDTDLLEAQSNAYRRMSANLYETKTPGTYYHIHGSLEASTTLNMIGLPPYRPDLKTIEAITEEIESHVKKFTAEELEEKNKELRQAGVTAYKYEDFINTPHGATNVKLPPWSVTNLENKTHPVPLPTDAEGAKPRILGGIKVLELCRIIAGPVIGRILAEYGADVIKVTSPELSDVPFFQIDVNMGKHTVDLDLKTPEGRAWFDKLLEEADVILDGYRPGALEKLGYGPEAISRLAEKRGKGYVYVNENCFGYEGEWAYRAGWQQIADTVTGIAWAQGQFMGLDSPVIPPFPISDYGTGCMGAIAALTGLYHRATTGGSWHGKSSLMQYDLLLFAVGQYAPEVQKSLLAKQEPAFLTLRHNHSVDHISHTVLTSMKNLHPHLFDPSRYREKWYSNAFKGEVEVIKAVAEIEGIEMSFQRGSRPNGFDRAEWAFGEQEDKRLL
ncbi:hypothetical protein AJ80_03670 [Polytolypa hystricis UAMH7299]|uniref:CAIB/BAIF family enzyme n=1 Tax=Polytolypa hystricis (strain UAMH7299) TaxID=1447883 RepID=A0A2B7YGU1_POLH7|nr:hypothetical protein AJ80_03670 [Polytolypa hystricis UAMH7299]